MMRIRINKIVPVLIATGMLFSGCKKWDDHNALTDEAVSKNLFEQISEEASLSSFAELLTKSGYDKVIASSKTFTVFAPTNTALAGLDPSIVNDADKLKLFVGNHITGQLWYTTAASTPARIEMLNGKRHNVEAGAIEDAAITTANRYAKNGVLQVIDNMLPALDNCWETLENNSGIPAKQKSYLLGLFRKVFDATNAVQIGVDPLTGDPVYQPGTDSITTNLFWRNVYDLRDESKQYTFFVLTDDTWDAEVLKFEPWFVTGTADSTTDLSRWSVVKDLAVEGLYTTATVPDTLLSKFEVKLPVENAAIVETIKTSNGIIYIMNKMDVQPQHKIKQFYIEAENYRYTSHDRRGQTYFRDRFNPVTGKDFRDVKVYDHNVALFNINYRLQNVYSTTYKAYWVAVNDFQTATFSQKLGIETPTATTLGYTPVAPNNFEEVYIGEFTLSSFYPALDIYLTAANSGSDAANALVCDYIRLEPVF